METLNLKSKPSGFGLISFFLGLTLGLAVAAYIAFYVTKTPVPFLDKVDGDISSQQLSNIKSEENAVVKIAPTEESIFLADQLPNAIVQQPQEAKSNFNNITRGRSPVVVAPSINNLEEDESQKRKAYFLQVGAFRALEEADRMRARLAFLGFEASIYKKNKKGNLFYRVRMGPYYDAEELKQIKARLSTSKVKSHAVLVN